METRSSDDAPLTSTELTIGGAPARIDWHPSDEGGRLVIWQEPRSAESKAAIFAFAVFDGGLADGHWVSRPPWVRADEVAYAVFDGSRKMLAPIAADEEGEHFEGAATAVEVLDELLRDLRAARPG